MPDDQAALLGAEELWLRTPDGELGLVELELSTHGEAESDQPSGSRLEQVTHLLRGATRDSQGEFLDEEFFWRLPVGTRLHCLVLLCRGLPPSRRSWVTRCPDADCGAELELELPMEEFARAAEESGPPGALDLTVRGQALRLRPATADDLRCWRDRSMEPAEVLRDLMDPPDKEVEILPDLLSELEEAVAARDPLVDCRLDVPCPDCGRTVEVEVDLEAAALRMLRSTQLELLREVDRLAKHYHWSEAEILALPAWRRRRYLSLLEREVAWAT